MSRPFAPAIFSNASDARSAAANVGTLRKHAAAALAVAVFFACLDTLMNVSFWPVAPGGTSGLEWLGYDLVVVPSFFLSLFVAALAAQRATDRGAPYIVAWTTAIVAGCLLATTLQWAILEYLFDWNVFETGHVLITGEKAVWTRQEPLWMLLTWSVPTTLAALLYAHWRRAIRVRDRLYAAELARAERERQVMETQLHAMQARVEPQFLFDTLARVKALRASAPSRAAAQLDGLITYLRAALPRIDEPHSTLARELDLCRAYVEIEKASRSDASEFVVESPNALKSASLPPMVLLPLVARAVALADPRKNLSLRLRAELDRDHLRIELDSNSGATSDHSAMPDEVCERLFTLYRNRASARVERRDDRVCVTLELPLAVTADPADSLRAKVSNRRFS